MNEPLITLNLTQQNVQLIWEALENGNFPGRISELVAETRARIAQAAQQAQVMQAPEMEHDEPPFVAEGPVETV